MIAISPSCSGREHRPRKIFWRPGPDDFVDREGSPLKQTPVEKPSPVTGKVARVREITDRVDMCSCGNGGVIDWVGITISKHIGEEVSQENC